MKMRKIGLAVVALCAALWHIPAQAGKRYRFPKGTIWYAVQQNDLKTIQRLVRAKPSLVNTPSPITKQIPLEVEVSIEGFYAKVDFEVLNFLVAKTPNWKRFGGLAVASCSLTPTADSVRGLNFLLSQKIKPDSPIGRDEWAKNGWFETPLVALSSNWPQRETTVSQSYGVQCMKLLLKAGATPNQQGYQGFSALHELSGAGHYEGASPPLIHEGIKALLQAGAKPNIQDRFGRTPLHDAVGSISPFSGKVTPQKSAAGLQILRVLLAAKANPNISNKEGATPLADLIKNGIENNLPHTAHAAVFEAAKLLLEAGANPDANLFAGKTIRGRVAGPNKDSRLSYLLPLFSENTPAPALNAGEIALSGSIVYMKAGNKDFGLSATSFALPNGKSATMAQAKEKNVIVNDATLIHMAGKTDKIAFEDLKEGDAITVIGSDAGSGSDLTAREIVVGAK
jgi:ankyrin repeat protein